MLSLKHKLNVNCNDEMVCYLDSTRPICREILGIWMEIDGVLSTGLLNPKYFSDFCGLHARHWQPEQERCPDTRPQTERQIVGRNRRQLAGYHTVEAFDRRQPERIVEHPQSLRQQTLYQLGRINVQPREGQLVQPPLLPPAEVIEQCCEILSVIFGQRHERPAGTAALDGGTVQGLSMHRVAQRAANLEDARVGGIRSKEIGQLRIGPPDLPAPVPALPPS